MLGFKDFHCAPPILLDGIEVMHMLAQTKIMGDRNN